MMHQPHHHPAEINAALDTLPVVTAVITSAFEGDRAGLLVNRVVKCSDDPPCVCIVARKGHPIAPLIRDSRHFALCLMRAPSRLLERYFSLDAHGDFDPFDGFKVHTGIEGAPILADAAIALNCEVIRHFDLETDHELYIGHVLTIHNNNPRSAPRPRENTPPNNDSRPPSAK